MEEARRKSRARRGKDEEKKCEPQIPDGINPDDYLPDEPEEMKLWKNAAPVSSEIYRGAKGMTPWKNTAPTSNRICGVGKELEPWEKIMPTLDELREEMHRDADEIRITKRIRQIHQMQVKKQNEADKLKHEVDAAKFALQQIGGDEDFPELQKHWRSQIQRHTVLINEATSPIDCYITLTKEEHDLVELNSRIYESIHSKRNETQIV